MLLTRRLRSVLPLVALACCAVCLPIGCSIFGPEAHYYYPTELGAGARQVYAWPASGRDEFRFCVQAEGSALGDAHSEAETLHATSEAARITTLAADASSFTILLPKDADPSVRRDAANLIDQVTSAKPGLSTHCVTIRGDVHSILSGADLCRELEREGSFHAESRPAGLHQSVMGAFGKMWTMSETPNFALVPLGSGADRYAVYGDLRVNGEGAQSVECSLDQIAGLLDPGLRDPEARNLTGTWGSVDASGSTTLSSKGAGTVFVALYLPHGIPAERRAQCEGLAGRVCTAEFAPIVVAQVETNWEWSECTNAEFVRMKLPLDGDKSFIVGPVWQRAVLPKPGK